MKEIKLAQFLRTSREAVELTQIEVSEALGYQSSQFVSNWERGLSVPPMNSLRTLSKLYKVPMDEIFEHLFSASVALTEQTLKNQYALLKKRK